MCIFIYALFNYLSVYLYYINYLYYTYYVVLIYVVYLYKNISAIVSFEFQKRPVAFY